MSDKKFINRPTCAIILSTLAFVFVLAAFIVSQTVTMYKYQVAELTTITFEISWEGAGIYLGLMLAAGVIMAGKLCCCTFKHYKLEPNNKLLMANLFIEILATILTFVAAFGIFMFAREMNVEELIEDPMQMLNILEKVNRPTTIIGSFALGLGFFGSVTNLITLAKEK